MASPLSAASRGAQRPGMPRAKSQAVPAASSAPPAPDMPPFPVEDEDEEAALLAEPLLSSAHDGMARRLGPQGVIVLLCCINLLNYVDRGIIPGAPEKFDTFISRTLGVSVLQQSVYFGLLTSAFIASYSVFSMVFGYLSLSHRPFRIIAVGMSIWILAVVICGVAQAADSYYVLIVGRVISGVGEASFQCTATPFINRHAPPARRALYLGVYLASITVGTAIGYIYGSLFASSSFGWAGAYYFEAILMACLVVASQLWVPAELNQIPSDAANPQRSKSVVAADTPGQLSSELLTSRGEDGKASPTAFLDADSGSPAVVDQLGKPASNSFFVTWWAIFSNVPFLLVILGHSAYTFSLAALSTFSPAIFIGLGLFTSETTVSLLFGGLVAITGTIGTPVGGIIVDRLSKKNGGNSDRRCLLAVSSLFIYMTGAVVLGLVMVALTGHRAVFLLFLTACLFCLCALSVPETIAVLELFPESRRAMAISANTLVIHALGDVPSPIILGALKDSWAPHCGTVEIDGEAHLNPECSEDQAGLRNVLLFAVLWLAWGVLMWAAALFAVKKRQQRRQRVQQPTPSDLHHQA